MAYFEHQGRALHYLERGRGEPLILIHGLGSSGADWALQARALEPHCRLIVPDLPGIGHSDPLPAPRIEDMAAALWALCDRLGASRVDVVGFSLGGAVGLEMARVTGVAQRSTPTARGALDLRSGGRLRPAAFRRHHRGGACLWRHGKFTANIRLLAATRGARAKEKEQLPAHHHPPAGWVSSPSNKTSDLQLNVADPRRARNSPQRRP